MNVVAMSMMPQPGDVGFVEQNDFTSRWIRFAQHRKYGKDALEALYNHTFMVTSTDGTIIEADPTGMAYGNISEYQVAGTTVAIRRPPYTDGGVEAVSSVTELLTHRDKYGWVQLASVAVALMTGTKIRLGLDGTMICSGAESYALTRAGIDVGEDEEWNTPADLMHYAIVQNWIVVL